MGRLDSLDVMVGVYRTDVRGKKWYWSHYINIIDVLKSVTFKVFKLSNSGVKIDFLGFTCHIVIYYLKFAKLKKQIPATIIYQRKRLWRDSAAVAVNERTQGQYYSK